jgi:hypothetical protein
MCPCLLFKNNNFFLAMIPISEIASYRDIPVFGWLSNEESLDDKDKASTLVRTIYPLSQVGKVNLFFLYIVIEFMAGVLYFIFEMFCSLENISYFDKWCLTKHSEVYLLHKKIVVVLKFFDNVDRWCCLQTLGLYLLSTNFMTLT